MNHALSTLQGNVLSDALLFHFALNKQRSRSTVLLCLPHVRPQGFVDASIEGLKSTDAALRALRQFRAVLTREGLERGRRIPEPLALQYFRDMCKVGYKP